MPIPIIATTKFNKKTFDENTRYKEIYNINHNSCIYGTSIKIRDDYEFDNMYVIEMDNDNNKMLGIGFINIHVNHVMIPNHAKIYDYFDYNLYTYKGPHRISRDQLKQYDYKLVAILDVILFKGKTHVKRIRGISAVSNKVFAKWKINKNKVINRINHAFKQIYTQ